MFNAPEVITMIPDIQKIYDINDSQCEQLEAAVETMDKNIFLDSMDEKTFDIWMKYHLTICERMDLIGATNHSLDILRKKPM